MKDLGIESHKGTYYQKSNKDLFDQLKKENKHSKYLPKIHILKFRTPNSVDNP
ncbi:hypothetical protein [Tetragenococcus halophilus]|uniref:hypothetical protein n=1 Tax=Tetragenococcus halophilus TaxID=51669 RepID=UPI0030E9348F